MTLQAPQGDIVRSDALRSLQSLDCPQLESFDRIVDLVTRTLGCQSAVIRLVEEDRSWSLTSVGRELPGAPRDASLSALCVERGEPCFVADARTDERFGENPLVSGPPHVRSWAGAPIRSPDDIVIGALCVFDPEPGKFSEADLETLQYFAKTVDDLIRANVRSLITHAMNEAISENAARLEGANMVFRQAERVAKIGTWNMVIESGALEWSDQVYALHGRDATTPITLEDALNYYQPEDRSMVQACLEKTIATGKPFEFEASILSKDRGIRRIKTMGELLKAEGFPDRLVGIIQDITDTHAATIALKRAADHDSLTHLYNRYAFDRLLKGKIEEHRKKGGNLFMILADLDGFKDINDTYGHLVGDVVLEEISDRLARAMPDSSVLARWGGDEFAIIAPVGASQSEIEDIVRAALETISTPIQVYYDTVRVGATCGIAQFKGHIGAKEMVRMADLALYHGKNREVGTFHHYSPKLEKESRIRQDALSKVRKALDGQRLYAGYQPIVDLTDAQVVGFEALMRLKASNGETVTAGDVLPALVDPTMAREIGVRMLDQLCQDFKTVAAAYPDLQFISINASEADLLGSNFCDHFLEKLRDHAIEPTTVTLEVTETMLLVNDTKTVRTVLHKLHRAGVSIALDDFGTGYSSLSHLRDFPIGKVKIDRSFIQDICDKHETRMIVHALVAMGRSLEIDIVAEGIETDAQRNLLMQMGCAYGQGFLFSPAQSASRISLGGTNAQPRLVQRSPTNPNRKRA